MMVAINMNLMLSKVIGIKVYLWDKGPSRLSKDFGPKKRLKDGGVQKNEKNYEGGRKSTKYEGCCKK
jgi:hypothetical protein